MIKSDPLGFGEPQEGLKVLKRHYQAAQRQVGEQKGQCHGRNQHDVETVSYTHLDVYKRQALGRMQYEFSEFQGESHTAGGITVKKGDCVLTMHIPSCGPLTKDLREDSYRRAYTFYQKDFPGKPVIFTCSSWLLYPPHDGMLPKSSNVVSFLHDFDPVFSVETDTFDNAWRIYGADGGKPLDQLPQNTSMQRAYANWLRGGHKAGWGYGIFMFRCV